MRTQKEQIRNFLKGCFFGLGVVTLLACTTGCSDKGNKNNTDPYYGRGYWGGGGYGGRGYGGNGTVSSVAVGADSMGRADLILEFATDVDPAYNFGTSQVWAEGELQVYQPIQCPMNYMNGLDAGVYRVYPMNGQPGQAYGELYQNMVLVAEGRYGDALINVQYIRTFNNFICGGNLQGMMGQIDIQQANGMPCGILMSITDMDPGMCR